MEIREKNEQCPAVPLRCLSIRAGRRSSRPYPFTCVICSLAWLVWQHTACHSNLKNFTMDLYAIRGTHESRSQTDQPYLGSRKIRRNLIYSFSDATIPAPSTLPRSYVPTLVRRPAVNLSAGNCTNETSGGIRFTNATFACLGSSPGTR